ncbi:MAG: hypothetical protein HEP71_25380 [Roseivirga sp.]|nr:hypothetical protein [Roseivirga sp.]
MSKRALVKYLQTLDKKELESQVLELYAKFKPVRDYYGFVFNPKEDKLIEEAKFKVSKEYFPTSRRRPKARRSVAHKAIKNFLTLELDPALLADFMLFNIETAMRYNARKPQRQDAFYKSIFGSFEQVVEYIHINGLRAIHWDRMNKILDEAEEQQWYNAAAFERVLTAISN